MYSGGWSIRLCVNRVRKNNKEAESRSDLIAGEIISQSLDVNFSRVSRYDWIRDEKSCVRLS